MDNQRSLACWIVFWALSRLLATATAAIATITHFRIFQISDNYSDMNVDAKTQWYQVDTGGSEIEDRIAASQNGRVRHGRDATNTPSLDNKTAIEWGYTKNFNDRQRSNATA